MEIGDVYRLQIGDVVRWNGEDDSDEFLLTLVGRPSPGARAVYVEGCSKYGSHEVAGNYAISSLELIETAAERLRLLGLNQPGALEPHLTGDMTATLQAAEDSRELQLLRGQVMHLRDAIVLAVEQLKATGMQHTVSQAIHTLQLGLACQEMTQSLMGVKPSNEA